LEKYYQHELNEIQKQNEVQLKIIRNDVDLNKIALRGGLDAAANAMMEMELVILLIMQRND
jgi:hypothetical protein